MSTDIIEPDEGLYQLYLGHCLNDGMHPSIRDYIIWKTEQGYDTDEPDWGNTMTDERAEDMFHEATDVE